MHTIYDVNNDTEYHFIAANTLNAMGKMKYMLNLVKYDSNSQIEDTERGYLLTHGNNEFWAKKHTGANLSEK